jgi:AcrR family transcriptional regulator
VARPRTHDENLRLRLLDEGARLLASEGPAALTTRGLAERAQTSSSAVYTLFGDKSGLVGAMFVEGFRRLAHRFAEVRQTDDPEADLIALGQAFRANALANPNLYDLMFGSPFPGFAPDDDDAREALGTFQALVDAVQRGRDEGAIVAAEPLEVALVLFGMVHGLASLELKGWLGAPEQAGRLWDIANRMVQHGLRPPG